MAVQRALSRGAKRRRPPAAPRRALGRNGDRNANWRRKQQRPPISIAGERVVAAPARTSAAAPPTRVFANGCWDLLHCGHFNAFRQARELAARFHDDANANGDLEAKNGESVQQSPAPLGARRRAVQLVVGLHSNDTVLREKGKQCVMTDAEREELLLACAMVDEVVPDVPYAHITHVSARFSRRTFHALGAESGGGAQTRTGTLSSLGSDLSAFVAGGSWA